MRTSPWLFVGVGALLLSRARDRGGRFGRSVVLGGNRWPLRARFVRVDPSWTGLPTLVSLEPDGIPVRVGLSLYRGGVMPSPPKVVRVGDKPDGWQGEWPPPLAHVTAWVGHWIAHREGYVA